MAEKKKLSRNQWVRDLISSGKSEEEILKIMIKGNQEEDIKPIDPPFNKLVYKRAVKHLIKKEQK